jgi:hypothetical protein
MADSVGTHFFCCHRGHVVCVNSPPPLQFCTFLYFEAVVFHRVQLEKTIAVGRCVFLKNIPRELLLHFIGEKLIYEDR